MILKDEKDASDAVEDMVKLGFKNRKEGFKVLMPKESNTCKKNWIHRHNRGNTRIKKKK